MMSECELQKVKSLDSGIVFYGIVALAAIFIIGFIDGYIRPLSCNS